MEGILEKKLLKNNTSKIRVSRIKWFGRVIYQNIFFFTEGKQVIPNHVVAYLNRQYVNFFVAKNKTVSATQQSTYNKSYVF